ncbi:MAG TPA: type IV pilus assembly protein PilM, partial [Elusimicrobiales bacterium]|nr:type IV pilus assembly protein PilM [Elusimicrobiales bacterium]
VSVGGSSVIVRYVAISHTNKQDIKKILVSEAEPFIPFEISDVNLDCHLLGDIKQGKQTKTEIILIAAKQDLVKSKIDLLNSAKLQPVVVDIDAFAIENLCQKLNIRGEESGVIVLNIGNRVTNLSIIEKGLTRVVRDIMISGQYFTKAIARECDIDFDKAENLKKEFGVGVGEQTEVAETAGTFQNTSQLPPSPPNEENSQNSNSDLEPEIISEENAPQTQESVREEKKEDAPATARQIAPEDEKHRVKVSDALKQNLKDLSSEVKRSMDFYYSQGKDRSISKVYLTGGSSAMKNMDKFLEMQLNMPVEVLDPCIFSKDKKADEIDKKIAPGLSVACGLALRKIWDWI